MQSVKDFISKYWKWLLAVLVVVLVFFGFKKRKSIRRRVSRVRSRVSAYRGRRRERRNLRKKRRAEKRRK